MDYYNANRLDYRNVLSRISSIDKAQIVDVDWRLDYNIKVLLQHWPSLPCLFFYKIGWCVPSLSHRGVCDLLEVLSCVTILLASKWIYFYLGIAQ